MSFRSGTLPKQPFPFEADWSATVKEYLEYKTDVLRSYSGKQQRRSLRQNPRYTIEYNVLARNHANQRINNLMLGQQQNEFYVPLVHDVCLLNATANAGTNTLFVSTTDKAFVDNGYALVIVNERDFELVEITTVTATSLQLSLPLVRTWNQGVKVYPATVGHTGRTAMINITDTIKQFPIYFDCNPETTPFNLPVEVATDLHTSTEGNTYEVFRKRYDWSQTLSVDYEKNSDRLDVGIGVTAGFEVEQIGFMTKRVSWLCRNRSEIMSARSFVNRSRGASKAFYTPSGTSDLTLVYGYNNPDTSIVVYGDSYHYDISNKSGYNAIIITLKNGNQLIANITSTELDRPVGFGKGFGASFGGADFALYDTKLNLDTALGESFTLDDVVSFNILELVTMNDRVVFEWLTNDIMRFNTSITTVVR